MPGGTVLEISSPLSLQIDRNTVNPHYTRNVLRVDYLDEQCSNHTIQPKHLLGNGEEKNEHVEIDCKWCDEHISVPIGSNNCYYCGGPLWDEEENNSEGGEKQEDSPVDGELLFKPLEEGSRENNLLPDLPPSTDWYIDSNILTPESLTFSQLSELSAQQHMLSIIRENLSRKKVVQWSPLKYSKQSIIDNNRIEIQDVQEILDTKRKDGKIPKITRDDKGNYVITY
jgi:hypothetical protein